MAIKKAHEGTKPLAKLRHRAQRQLKKRPTAIVAPLSELSKERLLHELQVHRVELELQNEELKQGKAEAEFHLEQHTALYDEAPVGYFTLSAHGVIKQANLTGANLLGINRAQLVGRPFIDQVPELLQVGFHDFLRQVFDGPTQRSGDFEINQNNQPPRPVNIKAKRLLNGTDCQLVVGDITERKRAETAFLHSKAMLATIIAQSPTGIFVVGPSLRIKQINPIALTVFYAVQPLLGRDLAQVMTNTWTKPEAQPLIDAALARFRHTLQTGEPYHSPDLIHHRCQKRIKKIYEWQIQRVRIPNGELGVVCFFSDITERLRIQQAMQRLDLVTAANKKLKHEIARRLVVEKALTKSEAHAQKLLVEARQLQKKIQQVSHSIIRMQEMQRKQISTELHDGIGQLLIGIDVQLAALAKKATIQPNSIPIALAPVHQLVTKSVQVLHGFARELRPAMLDDLGLVPALRSYIEDIPKLKGRRIEFTATGNLDTLDADRRTVLYRVAQESLLNVTRHAQASYVLVTLAKVRGGVRLQIVDNGQAFDVKNLASSEWGNRLGLSSLRERVDMVGGRFTVKSTPRVGTTIQAVIPLA